MPQYIKSKRILTSSTSEIKALTVAIEDEIIADILPYDFNCGESKCTDFGSKLILPAIVDTHAHINEPGRTEWEGFHTATKACAKGGIATVVDMPLNSIPATTSLAALKVKQESALKNCFVDYAFWGGVIPGNTQELEPMIQAGVVGFKCFLCPSGVDEFPHVNRKDLELAMPILAKHNIPLIVHAEIESENHSTGDHTDYKTYLQSRPKKWENDAIELMIELCEKTKCRVHIVHLSCAEALGQIRKAKQKGLPFTVETCPHYLSLTSEEISKKSTQFKCAPPIREKSNQTLLWDAVVDGTIDLIVSDHSPCSPNLKCLDTGDFMKAWGGISSIQFSLPIIWTEMKKRNISLNTLVRTMCENTSKLAGLDKTKGTLTKTKNADFIVFDENAEFKVTESIIEHKNKVTPYKDFNLLGNVEQTYIRGKCVYKDTHHSFHPYGKLLTRERSI